MPAVPKRAPEKLLIASAGRKIPVVIRRNTRAKRLILRIDEALGLPILTLPAAHPLVHGEDFLRRHIAWLEERDAGPRTGFAVRRRQHFSAPRLPLPHPRRQRPRSGHARAARQRPGAFGARRAGSCRGG